MSRPARIFLIFLFFVSILAAALLPASCASPVKTGPTGASTEGQPAAGLTDTAAGGNLHYQNMVLDVKGTFFFNSSDGCLSKLTGSSGSIAGLLKEAAGNLSSDGERLFYTEDSLSGSLAKINLDGTSPVRIRQSAMKYVICGEDCLYGIEVQSGTPVQIGKDGANRKALADFQAVAMALSNGRLFITGAEDKNGLAVVDLKTGSHNMLMDKKITSLNVAGDWLYFCLPSDNDRLYAFSTEQNTSVCISRFSVNKPFIVSRGYLYFINIEQSGRLYRLPVSGDELLHLEQAELIVDDLAESFVVCGDDVFYQRPASMRIYRVSTIDLTVSRIT